MLLQSLTISMFGLEKQLWDETPKSEQQLYVRAFLFFLFFWLLSIASGITLLFLITSSIFLSIPLGLILSFVVGSIVRFSLVILRKSIFDSEKIKPEKKVEIVKKAEIVEQDLTVENENIRTNEPINQRLLSSKIETFNNKLKALLAKISEIRFLKSDTPIPILTSIVRVSILSIVGFLILFPLVCLLHFNKIEELNQSKRESYIDQFIKDAQGSLEMKTAYLKKEIQKTQNEINQQGGLLKDKADQLKSLNQQLSEIISIHNQEFEDNLNAFKDDIGNRYFIVHSFQSVTRFPFFLLVSILVAWVLIRPHFILYRLKTNKNFIYADLSTKFYQQKIEEAYNENQNYIIKYLQDEFQYTPPVGYQTIVWENPPYCSQKSKHFNLRNKSNKDELITSLIKPSI